MHRLVAPSARPRTQVARQQIRRVGLEHQPARRDASHHIAQVLAAALIADPARDTDVQIQFQVSVAFPLGAGEAVHHRRAKLAAVFAQDTDEALEGIAFMHEHRFARARRDLELAVEGALLIRARREIPIEIQTGLAHRDDFGPHAQFANRSAGAGVPVTRVMRVHTGRREQAPGPRAGQCRRRITLGDARARHDHLRHARMQRTL